MQTDLRDRIIDEALVLFERHGFHGVSVSQLVEASGTSKGGFYHHFQSKDELLYVIHDYFITYVLNKAREADISSTYPTEKLQRMIQSFVKVFDLYKPHISVFYQESNYLKPLYEKEIRNKRQSYKELLFRVIEEGIRTGEFRPEVDVSIIGMSILGMVNWSYKWYRQDGEKSIEEIADIFVDFIFQGLLSEQAKADPRYEQFLIRNSLNRGKQHAAGQNRPDGRSE